MVALIARRLTLTLLAVSAIGACDPERASTPVVDYVSQGVVNGFIRNQAGQGVANVVVCATAVFDVSGTPVLSSRQVATNSNGSYVVPVNFMTSINVRAGLEVTANPPSGSGLAGKSAGGLSLLITTTLPPAETTHVDVTLAQGTPPSSVLCTYGGYRALSGSICDPQDGSLEITTGGFPDVGSPPPGAGALLSSRPSSARFSSPISGSASLRISPCSAACRAAASVFSARTSVDPAARISSASFFTALERTGFSVTSRM